jgi:hypothetical protein
MKNIVVHNPPSEPGPSKGFQRLEDNLELCHDTVRQQLERAAQIDPVKDQHGHAAAEAYEWALQFLKMSAKLGLALGKMRGEFTNNIRIHKPDDVRELHKRLLEIEKTSGRVSHVYEEAPPEDVFGEYEDGEGDPPSISRGSNGSGR